MRILIVKLSSLGDVVHTLPVVQDLHAAFAGAQVDWVIEPAFAPVLAPLVAAGAVRRVIQCALRRWRRSFWTAATRAQWRDFTAQLRAEAYDVVIDLQGLSKSALVARLARLSPTGQRVAMANRTQGSGYEAATRWVADLAITLPVHSPAVSRGRALAAAALGYTPQKIPDFGLNRPLARTNESSGAIKKVASEMSCPVVALVHGTSRADKAWPLAHWVALGQRLNAAGFEVALVHGSTIEQASSRSIAAQLANAAVWPLLGLDELTVALAGCAGVVGVDSGVSHIAVALGLRHVQLYNFDTAWRTGPDVLASGGRQRSVFAQPVPAVDSVWHAWCQTAGAFPAGDADSAALTEGPL